jgi:crotonobetainyl-CoA:carnitine CoA-transferase CaiB-like acyl-CoA transferase
MSKPLEGLRVLDLTHMLSGPYGAMILADLGAETIKVEPLHGEGTRKLLATNPSYSLNGQGAYFITLNRNKSSVAIDLKSEQGLQIFYDMVRHADIVIDNFSAGVTGKLGIDYARLAEVNPRIITCSVSGFGSNGPNYQRPAFDQVVQALGGGMSITGSDQAHPMRAGIPIGDLGGGMFAVMGILEAVYERQRSGEGQHVDISMLDCQISMLNYMATMYFMSGEDPFPIGNSHFVHVPYNSYRTRDGHIIIAVIFDSFWENLLEVIDYEPFRAEKYLTQPGRLQDKALIDAKLNEIFATNTSDYWLQKLEAKRIPCARVNRFSEALADEQVIARNMVVELHHPQGGSTRGPGNPIKLSRTAADSFSPAPLVGEHTEQMLAELGYGEERIAGLRQAGVIA